MDKEARSGAMWMKSLTELGADAGRRLWARSLSTHNGVSDSSICSMKTRAALIVVASTVIVDVVDVVVYL